MKRLSRLAPSAGLVLTGFVLGHWAASPFSVAPAQVAPTPETVVVQPVDISEDNAERIREATDALSTAQSALQQDGLYKPVIRGLNAYATLSGGVDAVTDLESGRGVDPVTFAGLHAGLATDDVLPHLGFDPNGRLTYKGKLVRIYSVDRMKQLNNRQLGVLEAAAGGRRERGAPQP